MKLKIISGLLLLIGMGAPVFAQEEAFELPEPVLSIKAREPVFSAPAGFWLPNFDEVVYYLWNFDTASPPETMDFIPYAYLAQAAMSDAPIPSAIRNNRYFVESVRLANLAQTAFEDGDYDASTRYAEEAVRYAQLSDEWVRLQLTIKETDDAITAARLRLEWAASSAVEAARRYPQEFGQAETSYADARNLRRAESWEPAIGAARQVIAALANVDEIPPEAPPQIAAPPQPVSPPQPSVYSLPAQYTVRPWNVSKDCLWNIAGRPWAYNDPKQWRLLYIGNMAKMPQPDNPNLIHPGMVLDIPSIRGETREGMWAEGRAYEPLR